MYEMHVRYTLTSYSGRHTRIPSVECARILIVEVLNAMGPWRKWWLCMKRVRASVMSVERKRGLRWKWMRGRVEQSLRGLSEVGVKAGNDLG